jgi:hypothetical protein
MTTVPWGATYHAVSLAFVNLSEMERDPLVGQLP